MLKNHFLALFAVLFMSSITNGQIDYFKPRASDWVEPDSSFAKSIKKASQSWTLRINEFMASNSSIHTDESGEYEDWIEIHNYGDEAVDLNGMYVSDDPTNPFKFQLTGTGNELVMPAYSYFILWADDDESDGANHLSFKLSANGESILLTSTEDVLIDRYDYGQQTSDISEGLIPGTTSDWVFFTSPTPNAVNGNNGADTKLPEPEPSISGGFYNSNISVSINYPVAGATVYYTSDGSEPSITSSVWSNNLTVDTTTVLRLKAYKTGELPSNTASHSYIFDNDFALDIMSIQVDPDDMFGSSGLYNNENAGLEKPIHIEYFKNTGELGFEVNAGIKIHSPKSHPQKSFRIYARSEYGDNEINYKLFDDKDVDIFKRLILRNGSNDSQPSGLTHFKDGLYHQMFRDARKGNIYSAYRPIHVYINGLYWGIYNLRERQDEYFTEHNFGHKNADILEKTMDNPSRSNAIAGSFDEYNIIDNFIETNDMSIPENYDNVKQHFDIESYVDYYAFGIFSGNRDWIENNLKWWKPKEEGHKWQWMMWDVEYGLGTYKTADHGNPNFDTFYMSTWWGGWGPKPGTLTYVLRNLLTNEEFRTYFANRYADLMNTSLKEEEFVSRIDDNIALLDPDFDRQIERWGKNRSTWNNSINYLKQYVTARPEWCRKHVINRCLTNYTTPEFYDTVQTITIDAMPEGSGQIKINTIIPTDYPFDGIYFNSVPIQVTAIPSPGYQFSHWSEDTINGDWFKHLLLEDLSVTAYFEIETGNENDIVINEISYNQDNSWETGDWIELKNTTTNTTDISGWKIVDENNLHTSTIASATIPANDYLVIAQNKTVFQTYHPNVTNVIDGLSYGLASGGDAVRVYNNSGDLIDAVYFDNKLPWPKEADGDGPTLELKRNLVENTTPSNWFAFPNAYGTPGKINHFGLGIEDDIIENNVKIGPNPFNDQLTVISPENGIWTIYSLDGKVLQQGKLNANSVNLLQLNNLATGMYMLKLEFENNQILKPISKVN